MCVTRVALPKKRGETSFVLYYWPCCAVFRWACSCGWLYSAWPFKNRSVQQIKHWRCLWVAHAKYYKAIKWSQNCSTSWEERFRTSSLLCVYNYVTIIVPSQSYLLSFLHHPYMRSFSICNTFHLLVDVLSYDSSFFSPHPFHSD